ncbi:hypothetical protein BDF22DRAFT_744243 [Syncephalis plumigaleata]|nr:hypothetical protein BDF22DRAFT_744243 [Syncephalis plumigaleata]
MLWTDSLSHVVAMPMLALVDQSNSVSNDDPRSSTTVDTNNWHTRRGYTDATTEEHDSTPPTVQNWLGSENIPGTIPTTPGVSI